jgi:hypothetical protein
MGKGEISMSIEKNVEIVKNFLAAIGRRDKQGLLALSAEDIEWIIPGEDWPLAGTHRGHAGLGDLLQQANETVETSYPKPPEFVAQGDHTFCSFVIGVMPKNPIHALYGLKRITDANKPAILDWSLIDDVMEVGDEEAWEAMRMLASNGVLAGPVLSLLHGSAYRKR